MKQFSILILCFFISVYLLAEKPVTDSLVFNYVYDFSYGKKYPDILTAKAGDTAVVVYFFYNYSDSILKLHIPTSNYVKAANYHKTIEPHSFDSIVIVFSSKGIVQSYEGNIRVNVSGNGNAEYKLPYKIALLRDSLYANGEFESTQIWKKFYVHEPDAKYHFRFRNTGNIPLVINSCRGSSGSVCPYGPKEPIMPGDTGEIVVHYDPGFPGPFYKTIRVFSNDRIHPERILLIKGVVVREPTTYKLSRTRQDIGQLNFGESAAACFDLENTGNRDLYFFLLDEWNPRPDLVDVKLIRQSSNGLNDTVFLLKDFTKQAVVPPGEKARLCVVLKNNYGNAGAFQHEFEVMLNSEDTAYLCINGTYAGVPPRDTMNAPDYPEKWHRPEFYYKNGRLFKVAFFSNESDSVLISELIFNGANSVTHRVFNTNNFYKGAKTEILQEHIFENDKLIRTLYYKGL